MPNFDEVEDAEYTVVDEGEPVAGLVVDRWGKVKWRTKEGLVLKVSEMTDSHLRNTALFLMGMGYTKCIAPEPRRIIYLTALRTEWERRISTRKTGMRVWRVDG